MSEVWGPNSDKPVEAGDPAPTSGQGPLPVLPAPSSSTSDPSAKLIPAYRVSGDPDALTTLRRMDGMEAQLARTKLESEGIPCYIDGLNTSTIHPLLFRNVRLEVRKCDFARAEEILAQAPAKDMGGDYADEEWRCPRCHRKEVELVPLSRFWRRVRRAWLIVFVLPFLLEFVKWLFSSKNLNKFIDDACERGTWVWVVLVVVIGLRMFTLKRYKRCCECGHQSAVGASTSDAPEPNHPR
jgi:hypothetical protein